MAQKTIPFPDGEEHPDRILRTALYLMNRGRYEGAFELLQLAAVEPLTLPQSRHREELLARLEDLLDQALDAQALPPAPGRLLPFRLSSRTCERNASHRLRSSSST